MRNARDEEGFNTKARWCKGIDKGRAASATVEQRVRQPFVDSDIICPTAGPVLRRGYPRGPEVHGIMPDWWLEVTLPAVVFGVLFILWIALPGHSDEEDLGSKIRNFITRKSP